MDTDQEEPKASTSAWNTGPTSGESLFFTQSATVSNTAQHQEVSLMLLLDLMLCPANTVC